MNLTITITDAGRAALINATNTGTLPITLTHVGLGSGKYTPTTTHTSLETEIKRIDTFSGNAISPDTLHISIRDESKDTYTLNEFGVFTDAGVLFAIYSSPTDTILEKTAGGTVLIAVDIQLANIDTANIIFGNTDFLYPPATEQTAGVLPIASATEVMAGTAHNKAVTPKTLKPIADANTSNTLALATKLDKTAQAADSAKLHGYQASEFIRSFSILDGTGRNTTITQEQGIKFRAREGISVELSPVHRGSNEPNIFDFKVLNAPRLQSARKISLTGDLAGEAMFDGSKNISIAGTVWGGMTSNQFIRADVGSISKGTLTIKKEGTHILLRNSVSGNSTIGFQGRTPNQYIDLRFESANNKLKQDGAALQIKARGTDPRIHLEVDGPIYADGDIYENNKKLSDKYLLSERQTSTSNMRDSIAYIDANGFLIGPKFISFYDYDYITKTAIREWAMGQSKAPNSDFSFAITSPDAPARQHTTLKNNGDLEISGGLTQGFSDERLKKNQKPLTDCLDAVNKWAVFYFKPNAAAKNLNPSIDTQMQDIGIGARSVQATHPELTCSAPIDLDQQGKSKSGHDYLTLRYERTTAVLVGAIQELTKKIHKLEKTSP